MALGIVLAEAGHICLNWRLVTMPDWVRDYVIIHELMHLKRLDHSPKFWKLVAAACPEYQRSPRVATRAPGRPSELADEQTDHRTRTRTDHGSLEWYPSLRAVLRVLRGGAACLDDLENTVRHPLRDRIAHADGDHVRHPLVFLGVGFEDRRRAPVAFARCPAAGVRITPRYVM